MLEATDLSFGYGLTPVFAGVNCNVRRGEMVGVVGRSGIGKSSLLNVLAGYSKPTTGVVRFADEQSIQDAVRKQRIGFVFQSPTLLPFRTVEENVQLPLAMRSARNSRLGQSAVTRTLVWARIEKAAKSFPHELSGGMQTRAALARALVYTPELVLLDEPFTGLDEELREELQRQLQRMTAERGLATVIVSHDLRETAAHCNRIYVMAKPKGGVATLVSEHTVRANGGLGGGIIDENLLSRLREEIKGTS